MIYEIMDELATYLKIRIINDYEMLEKPEDIYGVYRIKEIDTESPHKKVRTEQWGGNQKVQVSSYYLQKNIIGLYFYGRGKSSYLQNQLIDMANGAWHWFQEDGSILSKNNGALLKLSSNKITSEVRIIENCNNYQVGFDFSLIIRQINVERIKAVTDDYTTIEKKVRSFNVI